MEKGDKDKKKESKKKEEKKPEKVEKPAKVEAPKKEEKAKPKEEKKEKKEEKAKPKEEKKEEKAKPKEEKKAAPKVGDKRKAPSGKDEKKEDNFNQLFVKRPRTFGIGGSLRAKPDLTRFVKWPRYVRLQRQTAILKRRLKVPPAINQFSRTLDKKQASEVFKLLTKYKPETPKEKKTRLLEAAKAEANKTDKPVAAKPKVVKFGLNHITHLVEAKKAKLVVIAHDVDPIELVVWLPALCKKMEVPYCIVKSKARLGTIVHQKTATALALTDVDKANQNTLTNVAKMAKEMFNDNTESYKWGGGVMGAKTQQMLRLREKKHKVELKQ